MRMVMMTVAIVVLALAEGASAQSYVVVDLGTLGGQVSNALGIDESGDVVGYSTLPTGSYRATLWQDGTAVNLGVLPGKMDSFANSVNAKQHVVGNSSSAIYYNRRAFAWKADDGMQDLGTLGGPGAVSGAVGINSSDMIVGWSTLVSDTSPRHAFLYADGTMIDLGLGTAYAINDDGVIAGDNGRHAVVWYDPDTQIDLGTLGGDGSTARGVNEWGLVVGSASEDSIESHAFIWDPVNGMSNLGTLGGQYSIANAMSGTIAVGESQTATGAFRAILYDLNGPGYPVDLNDLIPSDTGWVLTSATGINAIGQISGTGMVSGQVHAFQLIPQ